MGKSSPRTKTCRVCDTEFSTCWPKQIFCGKDCRRDFFNTPEYKSKVDRGTCSVDGCHAPVLAKAMCNMHYSRLNFYGSTDDPRIARRSRRFWARVEKTDTCWNWIGGRDRAGYGTLMLDGKSWRPHRYVYQLLVGPLPKELDHICHNRACVNPEHLRPVTRSQNLQNQRGARSDSKSGVRGVHWNKATGKWCAQACLQGKTHVAGYFDTLEEADEAAKALRLELFTHNEVDRGAA